ncbi:nitroreductase [Spiroplasma helicoides]|uniref:Nitroreductase n=1 Tax=Spiroplasma helicoides TaxID=216938 RepID=A0A1B3SJK2_9MOLU|nr:nitroreductase family protein [Spiroplasma helicoides]AOG60107.1 nitroreductase [Spiroplasma helicoides]
MSNTYEYIKNRRSAKRYQTDFELSEKQIEEILEGIRYSPSSFGMEPYRVYFIQNHEIREELWPEWWNQPAVKECSGLIIWTTFKEKYMKSTVIDKQITNITDPQSDKAEAYIKNGIESFLKSQNTDFDNWTARQVYISMGVTLIMAKEMGLDCCPAEGFKRKETDDILAKHGIINPEEEHTTLGMFIGKIDTTKQNHYSYTRYKRPKEEVYKIIK